MTDDKYIKRIDAIKALGESSLRSDDYSYSVAYLAIINSPTYSISEREKKILKDIRSEILGYNVRGRVSASESYLMGYASGMDKAAEIISRYIKGDK